MTTSFTPIAVSGDELVAQREAARALFKELNAGVTSAGNVKGSVKRIQNTIKDTQTTLLSWRFNEWDYYSKKITLPTNARGLFTLEDGTIICRGYDKFFNVNETSSLSEKSLQISTKGPYTLTVKSNGCIVFVSGLEDGTLVVCSKHSTGVRADLSRNHALAAQEVLERQLIDAGHDPKELAKLLHSYNITAVCEYCDDEFEEHVLEYRGDRAGLYLHGLNLNTVKFQTYPVDQVTAFARMFAFKETKYVEMNTFENTMEFMKECNKTGKFQNEEIEGFVVRCHQAENGDDYFFKYKFEEPYLLFRELREVTKQFINDGPENLKFGKHKLICMDYVKFIMPYLVTDEKLKEQYLQNKGIIELRKRYFASKHSSTMELIKDELQMIDLEDEMKKLKFGETKPNRYVLVTVATIGCGKTTTSVGLSNLYPELIDHIQNDNIQTPGKDKLVVAALDALQRKPIVIIDKNNHKTAERKQIFDAFAKLNEDIPKSKLKFICLNFVQNAPKGDIKLWETTEKRVLQRGDDHQSIKVVSDGADNAKKIMRGFISRFQPVNNKTLPDSQFDHIINLDAHSVNSSLANLKTIVQKLHKIAPDIDLRTPTRDEYFAAFENAKKYKPTFTKKMKSTKRKPNYFGVDVPSEAVLKIMQSSENEFYQRLQSLNRVHKEFHVTLVHSAMRREGNEKREAWETYTTKFKDQVSKVTDTSVEIPANQKYIFEDSVTATILVDKIVWDTKVLCLQVQIMKYMENGKVVDPPLPCGNGFPHITIGTIDKSFPPMLAGVLLKHINSEDEKEKKKALEGVHIVDLEEKIILEDLPLYAFMH
jgi:tRNA ligase